jgi:hypothetical protein
MFAGVSAALNAVWRARCITGSADSRSIGGAADAKVAFQRLHPALEGVGLGDLLQHGADLVRGEGLGDEVERTPAHRLDRGRDVGVGREEDDGRGRPHLHQPAKHLEAVVGPELQVQEHGVKTLLLDRLHGLGGIRGLGRGMPRRLDGYPRRPADRGFVVNDEDAHGLGEASMARKIRQANDKRDSPDGRVGGRGGRRS